MDFNTYFFKNTVYVEEEYANAQARQKEMIRYTTSGQFVTLTSVGALINGYIVVGAGIETITAEAGLVKYIYVSFDSSTRLAELLVTTTQQVSSGGVVYKLIMKVMYNPIAGGSCFVRDYSQSVIEVSGSIPVSAWTNGAGSFSATIPANVYIDSTYTPEFYPDYSGLTTITEYELINSLFSTILQIEPTADGELHLVGLGSAPTIPLNYKVREVLAW